MPPPPEPSVSDSIAYLQSFLGASDSALDGQGTRRPPPSAPQPLQPPSSLPASFLNSSLQGDPLAGRRRSPPSTISVLSHRSSAQHSTTADTPADRVYAAASPTARTSDVFWQRTDPAAKAPHFSPAAFAHNRSSLLRTENGPAANQADNSASCLNSETASVSSFSASKKTPSTQLSGAANMFRSGSDSTRKVGGGWRGAYDSSNHNGAAWRAFSSPSSWGQFASLSQQPQRPSSSLSTSPSLPSRERGQLWSEERLPWRRSPAAAAAAATTHHGSSLLWGWGNECGGATPSSPSPYQPSLYASEEHRGGSGPSGYSGPRLPARAAARASRESAYEEVAERETPADRQRRPPLVPSSSAAAPASRMPPMTEPVELTTCHNPEEHAANMRRIAHYLKDYYAREADEWERGVDSLTAEDVAGLAQCFYIDLYRTVRQARRAAGLDTSSFAAEDPLENVIASITTPPPPPQKEEEGRYTRPYSTRPAHTPGRQAVPPPPPPPPPPPQQQQQQQQQQQTSEEAAAENEEFCGGVAGGQPLDFPAPLPRSSGTRTASRGNTPERTACAEGAVSAQLSHSATTLLSSPDEELLSNPAATTHLVPNQQLAYSGGGTHPVQIVTARVPAFRNDDATANDSHGQTKHQQQQQQQQRMSHARSSSTASSSFTGVWQNGHHVSPSFTYHQRDDATDAASLSALAATPSPPYRHLVPVNQQPFAHGPPSQLRHPPCAASTATPPGIIKGFSTSPRHTKHHSRRGGQHVQLQPRYQDSSSSSDGGGSGDDSDGDAAEDDQTTCTAEGSDHGGGNNNNNGSSRAPRGPPRRATVAEPSSGIVKRPLKDLMPLLRAHGTLLVKHIGRDRRPHLRLFQVLDCIDVYHGKEVLMPHFTWAAAQDTHAHDRRPRAKKTRKGVPLPTGLSLAQQEVPYETALNLTSLEAVYAGVGRGVSGEYLDLFLRRQRDGAVLDHRRRPVANGMCAVFVFASRPVAVTFLREDDRQVWVGAMMGVVERNRTLSG